MHLHPPSRRSFRPFPIWESINDQFSNRKYACILRFGDLFVHFLFENRPITDFQTLSELYTRLRGLKKLFEIFTKYVCNTLIYRGATYNYKGTYRPTMGDPIPRRPTGWKSAEKIYRKKTKPKKKKHRNESFFCTRDLRHSFFRRTGISPVLPSRQTFRTAPTYSCTYLQKES